MSEKNNHRKFQNTRLLQPNPLLESIQNCLESEIHSMKIKLRIHERVWTPWSVRLCTTTMLASSKNS